MEILVPVALYKVFKKFPSGHVAERQFDVTLTLTSSGVVIRGLHDGGLSFLMPAVENVFADDILFDHYIQNCVARQQHVYLFQEAKARYFCNFRIAWTAT